ncbi:hypothetical protein OG217_37230 (plasmid) [Streptomyces sp. NBC_01023]|uniref:hypothetical protein n=1 Tax=unclassified Streptomyces TaxID=2593676 RepID=UPI0030E30BD8|nr:hypothetical protein OG217_37230 [Streptomyces sp. NBC_01023]
MGLFTPKYPKSDTPGADSSSGGGARRETRAERRDREARTSSARRKASVERQFQAAERASKERTASFWDRYERRNGTGSVDWN